jgi:hypothetical protein
VPASNASASIVATKKAVNANFLVLEKIQAFAGGSDGENVGYQGYDYEGWCQTRSFPPNTSRALGQ